MRYISVDEIEEGMVCSGSLYDYLGQVIVRAKTALTADEIVIIKDYGYAGIYIDDDLSHDIKVDDVISTQLRSEGLSCVRNQDIDGCKKVAKQIVDVMMNADSISIDVKDLRNYDNFTYSHSVNVAVYSCVIGIGLHFTENDLEKLVTAALLHDLGKLSIPEGIINKPTRLTPEEFDLMRKHPVLSYELIAENPRISKEVKQAVLSHHENEDGSGYPSGLKADALSIYSKILHVADVYDALVSERPYKNAYSAYEAAEYLMGGSGILFAQQIVESLIDFVPLYPKGTGVTLSDGRSGIIVENKGYHNLRPIVRLFDGRDIDLTKKENFSISIVNAKGVTANSLTKEESSRKKMINQDDKPLVMVVDDDIASINVLGIILEGQYRVVSFQNGRDAINYVLEREKPGIIIIDLDMPIMTGEETAMELQEMQDFSSPIVFTSDKVDERSAFASKAAHSLSFFKKPFNPAFIKTEIAKIISGAP